MSQGPILFGMKITMVVNRRGVLTLLAGTVDKRAGGILFCTDWPGLFEGVRTEDEGITWARGHLSAESPEARALLAAISLRGGAYDLHVPTYFGHYGV